MGTLIQINDAVFQNPNLPSLVPFVAKSNLVLGYTFPNRNFKEIVKNTISSTFAAPLKGTTTNSNSVPKATTDNLGIDINEACIDAPINAYTLKADGTTPITFMVVAGRNGEVLSSGQSASPYLSSVLNWGNDFGSGAGLMLQFASTGKFGVRYNNQDEGNIKLDDTGNKPSIYFVTYDGVSKWTLLNASTGATITSVSNAADMKAVSTSNPVQIGTKRTSDATYLLPFNMYQACVWNKVLSADEIQAQVSKTRNTLSNLAI